MTEITHLFPQQTWNWLQENPGAVLVDVRTSEEWENIGVPDLSSLAKLPIFLSWQNSAHVQNTHFIPELENTVSHETPVAFLCKGGTRSHAAAKAAQDAGYHKIVNVTSGFEGPINSDDPNTAGWKTSGLPITYPENS